MAITRFIEDRDVLEQLEASSCFGIAHNAEAPECRMCDMAEACWAKSASNNLRAPARMLNPDTEAELRRAKTYVRTRNQPEKPVSKRTERRRRQQAINAKIGLRETRTMSIDDLWAYLDSVGGECATYDNAGIQRMQLVLEIKRCLVRYHNARHPDDTLEL